MALTDEIRGFLAEHLASYLQRTLDAQREMAEPVMQQIRDLLIKMQDTVAQLSDTFTAASPEDLDTVVQQWSEQIAGMVPPSPPPRLPELLQAINAIDTAETQGALLQALLNAASAFSDGIAVFVVRGNRILGWQGIRLQGLGSDTARFRQFSVPDTQENTWTQVYQEGVTRVARSPIPLADRTLIEQFAGYVPQVFALFPIVVRGRTVGMIYADRHTEEWSVTDLAAMEILVRHAAFAIETMPARLEWIRAHRDRLPTFQEPATEAAVEPTPVDQQLLEEARRFARLLVQEIKMYNEQEVVMGRQHRDLYHRLKDDIERSRKVFHERYPQTVLGDRDFFYEELVEILADGDPSLLGIDHWPVETS